MKLVNSKLVSVTTTDAPTNHIMVVDCSGSMYSELSKIRTHLKNKIPTLVKQDDTLTVIWFSGMNEYGVLFERVQITGLTDLSSINSTIDRYLTSVGLTGFKQPLQEVIAVIKRSTDIQHSLIFMSDGYDNVWAKHDIIAVCKELSDSLVSSCFVEYGHYADHDMLMQMAEEVGGSLVQATDFSKYAFQIEMMKTLSFGKRITQTVSNVTPEYQFVVGHNDTGFTISKIVNNTVTFPSNTTSYSYMTGNALSIDHVEDDQTACAVVAALIQRGNADVAVDLAAAIGDTTLFAKIQNAFSKQDYSKVVDLATSLATGQTALYSAAPKSTTLVRDPNAYNVLELMLDLSSVEGNNLIISHPDFNYTSIGQKRTAVEIDGFTPVFTDVSETISAPISSLTFDSNRPNMSILVKRDGSVSLPDNDYGFGNSFNTFIWRNYTIVRDGIVNVSKLPVTLTNQTYEKLVARGLALGEYKVGKVFVIDLEDMPVINRTISTGTTMRSMIDLCFAEYMLECEQKYVKTLIESDPVGEKFTSMYGEDAALFLQKYGIKESGFSPKTESGDANDVYFAKILEVKMSGLSSVPKVSDVTAAIDAGKKLTPSHQALANAIKSVDLIISSGKTADVVFDEIKTNLKNIRTDIVMKKFGVILGRKWFQDSTGLDDTTREIDFQLGKPIKCEVILADKPIQL